MADFAMNAPIEIEPFVAADIAAKFLCISRRRLLQMARDGEIPAHPIGQAQRKTWRFRLSEIAGAIISENPDTGREKRGTIMPGGSLAVPKGRGN
jgi:hypothetical protein